MDFSFQKPYACQLPGCTKRYTDPSSLRKHVKNHAIKNQQIPKKKHTKEPEMIQKRLNLMLRERQSHDRFLCKVNGESEIQIKEEFIPQNVFYADSRGNQRIDDSTNSIDLMDISKCIMGIEEEKNDYENMQFKTENSASDEYNIEAIKKYLIEQPTEYIDLNPVKQDYFNSF